MGVISTWRSPGAVSLGNEAITVADIDTALIRPTYYSGGVLSSRRRKEEES
jgi:hypothetical protein